MLLQLLFNGLATGALYSLIAVGFALIYNTTRIFHFAHGAIYTASAYLTYLFLIKMGLPLWLSIGIALSLTSFLGILFEIGLYYPFVKRGASHLVTMIVSLASYIAVVNVIALFFGNETKILVPGIQKTYTFGSLILSQIQLIQILVFYLLFLGVVLLLRFTSLGKIIRALRDNPEQVVTLGVDVRKVRMTIFALGSILAGVAAILLGLDVGIDPYIGFPALLVGAVSVIIGGVGVFEGAAVGGLTLGILQGLVIWRTSARWQDAITFGILILFLLLKPEGLFGQKKRIEET